MLHSAHLAVHRVEGAGVGVWPLSVLYFSSGSKQKLLKQALFKASKHGLTIAGRVAQLAEHSTLNRQVVGSIPTASTI